MSLTLTSLDFLVGAIERVGHLPELFRELNRTALVRALSCVPRVWEAPKQCAVFSPSPNSARQAWAAYPSAGAAAPGVEEYELESHTDVGLLVSGYVTLGKVFNCSSLGFHLCKVSTGSFLPRVGVAKDPIEMQVFCALARCLAHRQRWLCYTG